MERLQNMEAVLPAQACIKPHTPDDHRSGKGMLHFNLSKTSPFPTQPVMFTHQEASLILVPTENIVHSKSKWTTKCNDNNIDAEVFQRKKLDRYCDGQSSVSAWPGQSPVIHQTLV